MIKCLRQYAPSTPSHHDFIRFTLKWTPRTIVAGVAGFSSLGIAYDKGVMAKIDRLAIRILRHSTGYVGIGFFMPTFQWYSAWSIRIIAGLGAGILYDLTERVIKATYKSFQIRFVGKNQDPSEPSTQDFPSLHKVT